MVNPDYLLRILDNISSNLLKYANKNSPIQVGFIRTDSCGGLSFENGKKTTVGHVESNRIGVRNICTMMEKMGGICKVEETKRQYRIQVLFRWG